MTEILEEHIYNAEATVLAGELVTPLEHRIKPQAPVELSSRGGYEAKLERDSYMSADEAKAFGLVDQVVENRPVPDGEKA